MDTKFPPPAEFNRHLIQRVRDLRLAAGLPQALKPHWDEYLAVMNPTGALDGKPV